MDVRGMQLNVLAHPSAEKSNKNDMMDIKYSSVLEIYDGFYTKYYS